jgi:hypothetical protein
MFVLWSEGQFAVKITIPQNTSFAEGYLLFTTDRSVKNEFLVRLLFLRLFRVLSLLFVLFMGLL